MKISQGILRGLSLAALLALLPLSAAQGQAPRMPEPQPLRTAAEGEAGGSVPYLQQDPELQQAPADLEPVPGAAAVVASDIRPVSPILPTGVARSGCCYPRLPQCTSRVCLPKRFRYYGTCPWDDDPFNHDWQDCFGKACGGNCGQHLALWWIDLHNDRK